ncbi:MAG: 4Fe-4S dicluster domain-containing protein [Ruminococcus sp.]|nr:4Fe-4S dicluster domain-containing protein [Ruminococcus sp.]
MEQLYKRKEACCGCGACADVCREGAIRMTVDREGFRYPRRTEEGCIHCERCIQVCPVKNRRVERGVSRRYFGVRAKEEKLRSSSSSGGMFPVLAEFVLERQGVVYGAAYGRGMQVTHQEISRREDLAAIQRTKYVQSSLKGIYRSIERRLRQERWVLFCGTPCQVQGLLLYLNREEPRLLLVNLVCYGVPSPGIWRDYVKWLEQKYDGKMTDFSFRDKRKHDHGHTCSYVIEGKEYAYSLYEDLYCSMYFSNLILRPSCHTCRFCTVERNGDFTIGDFWGIEKVKPEMDDGMGTSMVILHTEKAREIWEEVKKDLFWFACEEKDVLQPRLSGPTEVSGNRRIFMLFYRKLPFSIFQMLYRAAAIVRALFGRIHRKTTGGAV